MEVNRQIDSIFQGRNEVVRCFRFEEAGHIFNSNDIGTGILQFFCHLDIVVEVIFRTGRVENIAGIAKSYFGNLACFTNGLYRFIHVIETVQAVEDTEDVDTVFRREFDEVLDDVIGVARIAYGVGTTDQHLKQDIRCLLTHLAQPFPRIFVEETIGYVKGSTAPAFIGEEARQLFGSRFQDTQHIDSTYACSHEGLVSVTHSRIRQEDLLLVENPLGEFFRTHGVKDLFRPLRIISFYRLR